MSNKIERPVKILLPKGEWLKPLLSTLAVANLQLEQWDSSDNQNVQQCLQYRLSSTSDAIRAIRGTPPVVFQLTRSREVWQDINDPNMSEANCGFTGSDVALEDRAPGFFFPNKLGEPVEVCRDRSWEVPLVKASATDPEPPNSKLYFGLTPRFGEWYSEYQDKPIEEMRKDFVPDALFGTTLYTSYPWLTELFLYKMGFTFGQIKQENPLDKKTSDPIGEKRVKIKYRAGGIEGKYRVDPRNLSIVDVGVSLRTAKDNSITPFIDILTAKLYAIEGDNISTRERIVLSCMQADLELAARKVAPQSEKRSS